jgi:DNA invertase Pin-like site-specific DNA recombinase
MNGSVKIQTTHLERQAVVYLRQSSQKQVLENRESAVNQRALRDRLLEVGWKKNQVMLIDEDQGQSGKHASSREGFQRLVADVSLRRIGIIIGYEVSRLSRNNADWHRLLELCALFDTLIADADGIYHPRDFNDRLLLGLKGTLSEAELHSLRLRLDAGRLSKAKRGELIHHLPTGLVRQLDGTVQFHPDQAVQGRICLVFAKFRELASVSRVLRYLVKHGLKLPRRQTSGLFAGEVLWKDPSSYALYWILKNPAYAGAFAYGQRVADPARQIPGRPATGLVRQPRERWLALVKDVYPAYITWAEYEQNQATFAKNWQRIMAQLARKQATRGGAALLTGLLRCGLCGHTLRVVYKDRRYQYICCAARMRYAKPSCQFLPGQPVDAAVVQEFFRVLQPAQIDAMERVSAQQAARHGELVKQLQQEVQRLDYAAKRAERQYNSVDPENRLIAATLEKKWEGALGELEQAQARLSDATSQFPHPLSIPREIRDAFADVGRRLPEVWGKLSPEARKQLLRTLVIGVNLRRDTDGILCLRIVWRGSLVSELTIRLPVHSLRYSERERQVVARIRELADTGENDRRIAQELNREGHFPCRGTSFTAGIVIKLRCRHRIWLGLGKLRLGARPPGYTVAEMAHRIDIDPSWIYRRIGDGKIKIEKDRRYGCYLFPTTSAALAAMKRLSKGQVLQISFRKEHCNG